MAGYRLYFLDRQNHFRDVVVLECRSDDDACSAAEDHRDGRAMELWLRDRLVRSWPADED